MTALYNWPRITSISTPAALILDINPATTPVTKSITLTHFLASVIDPIVSTSTLKSTNFITADGHTATHNTTIGDRVRTLQGTGRRNTMIGTEVATDSAVDTNVGDIIGCDNTLIGTLVAQALSSGYRNCTLGSYALQDLTTGSANIAIGYRALTHTVDGYNNVGIGDGAMMGAVNCYNNTNVGIEAGLSTGFDGDVATTVRDSTCYGFHAGYGSAGGFHDGVGNYSTWIGSNSGGILRTDSTHVNSTGLGYLAGASGGANALFLGFCAGRRSVADNEFYLDALDRDTNANEKALGMMYGVFAAAVADQTLAINAQVTVKGALTATGGLSIGAAARPVVATDATVATLIGAMTTAGWIKNS